MRGRFSLSGSPERVADLRFDHSTTLAEKHGRGAYVRFASKNS